MQIVARNSRQCLTAALAIAVFLLTAIPLAPTALAEPQALDNAGLKQMLENMGYEPEEGNYPSGGTYWRIRGSIPGLNWIVDLAVRDATNLLWIEMDFWPLKDDRKVPYDVLLEVLERNYHLSTVRYMYLVSSRQFRLSGSIPNRDITPAQIRKLIDEAVSEAAQTEHLWNPNKWREQTSKESPEDEPAKEPEEAAQQ